MVLESALGISLRLFAVAALVVLNGFFVAAEFAIVKVRTTQLAARLEGGDRRAPVAQHVVQHLDAYLSATQLGITLASLGLGWIGEPAVARLIEPPLERAGFASPAVVHATSFALAFGFITFLHIVVGELAPKSLAIQRAEGVTLWTARPLRWFYLLFKPAIWLLNGMANRLLRVFGLPPPSEVEMLQGEEELRILLADRSIRETLGRERADVLLRVVQLTDLQARHVMTPRTRVVVLDANQTVEANLEIAEESGYTRYPLVDRELDKVVGMVHYRDLVRVARAGRTDAGMESLRRPVLFVPETKPAQELLQEMLRRSVHMAIVVDEHGATDGLVTLEDLFEELFGEIRDEFDVGEREVGYRQVGPDHFVMDGIMPLHQAEQILGIELPSSAVTTLSGYVVETIGHLPLKGEKVHLGPYQALVRELDRRRITELEVWREDASVSGGAEAAP